MAEEEKKDKVKRRKIRKTDWEKVKDFLKREFASRKGSNFRTSHEQKWREVDRQISMEAMKKYLPGGKEAPPSWNSAFELGELSKASEVICADTMRLVFPFSRSWAEAHVKPPVDTDPKTGKQVQVQPKMQKMADGSLRSLMFQQHLDFGLKARVELSVKEALHHGGFVTTVEWEEQNKIYDGQGVESIAAPVWVPHSMWNAYPDPSPSIVPGAIFYPGSMMIVSYMPRYKVLQLSGEGYMNISKEKIPKRQNKNKDVDTDDVELLTYYGDLTIERDDGDIFLPNSKCITANEEIIYYRANPLPFPEVIYQGYERQDLRDPYFTSPIVKNSPIQKLATILANKFVDGVSLWTQPPGTYDGNDAYLVQKGGPDVWPGAMSPTKGSNKVEWMKVGDPSAALQGLQLALQKLEEGTSVNAIRSGGDSKSDRKTAREVATTQQGAEVRTVDFVGKLESGGLRPFLYMQHELNLKHLKSYSFYCPEKDLPDFITFTKKELPKVVHFDVVGSKGLLGEQERSEKMTQVTAFASQNPLFAPLLNAPEILKDMYEDSGVKNAETYVNTQKAQIPPEVQMKMQQMQQAMQEMGQELQKAKSGEAAAMAKIELEKKRAEAELMIERARLEMEKAKAMQEMKSNAQEIITKANEAIANIEVQRKEMEAKYALEAQEIRQDFALKTQELAHQREIDKQEVAIKEKAASEKAKTERKKVSIKRTKDGYEVG